MIIGIVCFLIFTLVLSFAVHGFFNELTKQERVRLSKKLRYLFLLILAVGLIVLFLMSLMTLIF